MKTSKNVILIENNRLLLNPILSTGRAYEASKDKSDSHDQSLRIAVILNSLKRDEKANDFFSKYILPDGRSLPRHTIERYTVAASWLNLIIYLKNDREMIHKLFDNRMSAFWKILCLLIRRKKIPLPFSEKRLKERIKSYTSSQYESLINIHKYGNQHSRKIKGKIAEGVLTAMITSSKGKNSLRISESYNKWAKDNDLKPISPRTVDYWVKAVHTE